MKNYFIVGASSGIGRALANQLQKEGHRVYGTYRTTVPEEQNEGLTYHPLNVFESESELDFLPEQLDGFVYCPGSINLKPFARLSPESFLEDYKLNVGGAIDLLQRTLPRLKASKQASILFFSTVAVQQGFTFHSQVAASKGALEGLTRVLAAELAPTIRVNCIAPSLTDTGLASRLLGNEEKKEANGKNHPLHRIGNPEDHAEMAAFLLSEKSAWITGQILHVDGGKSTIKT